MHAHEDRSSHGEAYSDGAEDGEHSRRGRPSSRELARLRMKEIAAYVCVDDLSEIQEESSAPKDDVSPEAKRKRKQRKKNDADKKHYFNVKMPNDDPVLKETIKTVAATLIQDREFHRTLDWLIADPSLREIVDSVAVPPGDTALSRQGGPDRRPIADGKGRGRKRRTG
jgi:hypothetical protein